MSCLLGKKIGMTRFFNEDGTHIPATLIEAGPCTVVQIKTVEIDGYDAIQLGFIEKPEKNVNKPMMGHFKKADVKPHRILKEFTKIEGEIAVGDEIKVDVFQEGEYVDITGYSKGRGFTGVVKRHGFGGGHKSHGQGDRLRAPGSIGQSAYPKRVFKGMRMAGRMGNQRTTIQNLQILKVIPEKNQILVKGGIPGTRNSIVEIQR